MHTYIHTYRCVLIGTTCSDQITGITFYNALIDALKAEEKK